MRNILKKLFEHQTLSTEEAYNTLQMIASSKANAAEMAAFMTVFVMRPITVEELKGFRRAMLDLCIKPNLHGFETIDLCGTGGDGKNTFNISTLASFVTAGAGQAVTKHGNNGVSSISGSSNVLQALGLRFTNESDTLQRMLEKANICFLHAPLFHPAMKNVAPVRRSLGFKTFFNMLGPMVNPARPQFQLVGVFNLELLRLYDYLYQEDERSYLIVHALDGYDEISLTGKFKLSGKQGTSIMQAEDLGLRTLKEEELNGGESIEDAAQIFMNVLENKGTKAQESAVLANAGAALYCAKKASTLTEAVSLAKESLYSGQALESFRKCVEVSQNE